MATISPGDLALLALAVYIAIVALARLMLRHRDTLVERFRAEMQQEKLRQKQLERQRQNKEANAKRQAQ
jgi:hypothetical protein